MVDKLTHVHSSEHHDVVFSIVGNLATLEFDIAYNYAVLKELTSSDEDIRLSDFIVRKKYSPFRPFLHSLVLALNGHTEAMSYLISICHDIGKPCRKKENYPKFDECASNNDEFNRIYGNYIRDIKTNSENFGKLRNGLAHAVQSRKFDTGFDTNQLDCKDDEKGPVFKRKVYQIDFSTLLSWPVEYLQLVHEYLVVLSKNSDCSTYIPHVGDLRSDIIDDLNNTTFRIEFNSRTIHYENEMTALLQKLSQIWDSS